MKNGQVIVNFVPAREQITVILTKPLTAKLFLPFRRKLGVSSIAESNSSSVQSYFSSNDAPVIGDSSSTGNTMK